MKNTFLAVMVAGSVMAMTGLAHAADGTVNFTGNIIADACNVDPGSKDLSVNLGDVASTSFSAAGDKSSPTKFTINLTDCPDTVTQVSVKFDGMSNTVNSNLLQLDSGMTATNVGIEIADNNGNAVPLHTASPSYAVAADGTAALDFVGRYVATAASVGAGTANGTSQFTLNYQ